VRVYRQEVESRGSFYRSAGARPHGGWGNDTFELCMHQRKWELKLLTAKEAETPTPKPVPAADTAPAPAEPAPAAGPAEPPPVGDAPMRD
jgi:hypothetical protein